MTGKYSNSQISELGLKINNQPFYNVDEPITWLTTTYVGIYPGNVFTIAIPAANMFQTKSLTVQQLFGLDHTPAISLNSIQQNNNL